MPTWTDSGEEGGADRVRLERQHSAGHVETARRDNPVAVVWALIEISGTALEEVEGAVLHVLERIVKGIGGGRTGGYLPGVNAREVDGSSREL